jgi:hypothetical protein
LFGKIRLRKIVALRLMEVVVPENGVERVVEILKDQHVDELPGILLTAKSVIDTLCLRGGGRRDADR